MPGIQYIRAAAPTLRILAIALMASPAFAQPGPDGPLTEAMKLLSAGKPLAAIEHLETNATDDDDPNTQIAKQMLPTMYSFVGKGTDGSALAGPQRKLTNLPEGAESRPALREILRQAQDKQIVIINEAHDAPRDRAFIQSLAVELRELGFEYYAFEGLHEPGTVLGTRGFPTNSTGFYTQEPAFGELIRETLRLGYIAVEYEATGMVPSGDSAKDIATRERTQAKNIRERILAVNPQAKILIHVGHDHVMEQPRTLGDQTITWMAARLKQETGIDPLTIDQTTHWAIDEEVAPPPTEHIVLAKESGYHTVGHFADKVDIQVYHPPEKIEGGRPVWLREQPDRVAVSLPEAIQAKTGRLLIQAFYADEDAPATGATGRKVPADQLLLSADGPRPDLLLRSGHSYEIIVQNAAGEEVSRTMVDVTPD